ncbi:MAG: hypothetical protein Q9227_006969 [Pyrenula ochraceoflavens]
MPALNPATATWRWNTIPDYAEDRLSKEVLEQRLRSKYGNYKFYVEVKLHTCSNMPYGTDYFKAQNGVADVGTGRSRRACYSGWLILHTTSPINALIMSCIKPLLLQFDNWPYNEMTPLDCLIKSCEKSQEYPNNLVDAGAAYPSLLREYQLRRSRRADQLFCPNGQAAVEFFRYEERRKAFDSTIEKSLYNLCRDLPCAAGQIQKDRQCSFLFIGAKTSRDVLQIDHHMMVWLLSIFQVLPAFSEFVFPFGSQIYAVDFQFSGFREDNRLGDVFQNNAIPELGRSGQSLQICYNLKTVEPAESRAWPWSCRQAAVFHSFDVKHGQAAWIVIKANNLIRDRLKEVSQIRLKNGSDMFKSVPEMFANALACHLVLVEWSGENWRWYINYFEEQLDSLRRRAIVDRVTNSGISNATPATASHSALAGAQGNPPQQRRTWSWRGAFSRTNTTSSQATIATTNQTHQQNAQNIPLAEFEEPPNLPPEYDPKFQTQDVKEQEHEYKIDELQTTQDIDSKANEAILVLKSNIRILTHLQTYYQRLAESEDLDQALRKSIQASISSFARRVQSVQSDLQTHLDRLETIAKLIAECRDLLYGIVEYQSMQANKMFAIEAQRSAGRMEDMTQKMQNLTLKTTLETVLMRIITVVTVFFLPPTFVSTLMSTDIVKYDPKNASITAGGASLGAVKLFLTLTFSLMIVTFGAATGLYWWALRYADR